MNIGSVIQSYVITAMAGGYVMGKSPTAPSGYAVWEIDEDGTGVCCGHYFNDREEAEWDFCARAFEWFEDNVNVHMIDDSEADGNSEQPLEWEMIGGLRKIRADIASAARIVDEMCSIVDKLRTERGLIKCTQQR